MGQGHPFITNFSAMQAVVFCFFSPMSVFFIALNGRFALLKTEMFLCSIYLKCRVSVHIDLQVLQQIINSILFWT